MFPQIGGFAGKSDMLGRSGSFGTFGRSHTVRRLQDSNRRRQLQLWDELQQQDSAVHEPAAAVAAVKPAPAEQHQKAESGRPVELQDQRSPSDAAAPPAETERVPSLQAKPETTPPPKPSSDAGESAAAADEERLCTVQELGRSDADSEADEATQPPSGRPATPLPPAPQPPPPRQQHEKSVRVKDERPEDEPAPIHPPEPRGETPIPSVTTALDKSVETVAGLLSELELQSTTGSDDAGDVTTAPLPSAASPLDCLLEECGMIAPIAMSQFDFGGDLDKKIGEATYSDVYSMWRTIAPGERQLMAIKVIPIGRTDAEAEQLPTESALLEVRMTRAVGCIRQTLGSAEPHPNFVELARVGVCRGPYRDDLKNLWDKYDQDKGSENVPPNELADDQLYVIMVLRHGGGDLENTKLVKTESQAASVLLQTMLAVAQAEQQARFEHRDLHWGNVLVDKCTAQEFEYELSLPPPESGRASDGPARIVVPTAGVRVTIIDFTLSRIERDGELLFLDLEQDPEFFTGKGRSERGGDLQFDVYRWMRDATGGDWRRWCPRTNVLWMHYLCHKLAVKVGGGQRPLQRTLGQVGRLLLEYAGLDATNGIAGLLGRELAGGGWLATHVRRGAAPRGRRR